MSEATPDQISTRPAMPNDEPFLIELYKSSRGDDLRGLGWAEARISEFLEMQYEAQRHFYENDYKDATDELILIGDKPVGRLTVESRPHEIRCVDVALLPEHRAAGLGTQLIRRLQQQSKVEGKPLRLQVIRFNRAVSLFERLGFVRTSETGTHFQMEWTPE